MAALGNQYTQGAFHEFPETSHDLPTPSLIFLFKQLSEGIVSLYVLFLSVWVCGACWDDLKGRQLKVSRSGNVCLSIIKTYLNAYWHIEGRQHVFYRWVGEYE